MNTLGEQLERLAERGPTADPQIVIRRAELAASGSIHARPPTTSGPHPAWPLRLALATSAVAVIGSLVWLNGRSPSPSTPNTSTASEASSPAVASTTTTLPALSTEDAKLLAQLDALLDVATRDEMLIFLSANVPEADVAACMTNAGFQYTPAPTEADGLAADPRYTLSAEDYAASYGFGIAAADLGLLPSVVDPNLDYVRSLTEARRKDYNAWHVSCGGAWDPQRRDWSDAINAALKEFRTRVAADPRVTDALALRTPLTKR